MGRTVGSLRHASMCVYVDMSHLDEDDDSEFAWDDFIMTVRDLIQEKYPSFKSRKSWDDNESLIILENRNSVIGVNEYCGLVCISGRADNPLGERLLSYVEKHITAELKNIGYETLRRLGSFSNGEGIYEHA